jgi:hypothetical protein
VAGAAEGPRARPAWAFAFAQAMFRGPKGGHLRPGQEAWTRARQGRSGYRAGGKEKLNVPTTLSPRAHIQRVAGNHGWTVTTESRVGQTTVTCERGEQQITVTFDKRGAVTKAREGKPGGREITGTGKRWQVIGVLSRNRAALERLPRPIGDGG